MENCANNNIRSDNKKLYLSDLSKEVQPNANTSTLSNHLDKKNDENIIPIGTLLSYNTTGFKLIPLGSDSKTPAIKSTTEIYDDYGYWTTHLLKEEHYRFKNVATTFGKIYQRQKRRVSLSAWTRCR